VHIRVFGKLDQSRLEIVTKMCCGNSKVSVTSEIVLVMTQEAVSLKKVPEKEKLVDGESKLLLVEFRSIIVQVSLLLSKGRNFLFCAKAVHGCVFIYMSSL